MPQSSVSGPNRIMKLPSDYWDVSRALAGVGGDEEFLSERAGIFCAAYPTLENSLQESIAAKNYFRAWRKATPSGSL
jgi:hypothetical protein